VRVDIHLNFIGAFVVPADIVTPMELEEQRRIGEEKAAKEKLSKELEQERYEKRKQEKQEFTVRKQAGLLTPEETEADEKRREHSRAWQKEWRDKRQAALPPKPPKPLSQNEIIKRKYAGLPLTDEEYAIYRAWQDKKTEQARERREKQKASGAQKRYEDKTKAAKKAGMDAKKDALRAEDIAKGVFVPVGVMPRKEPGKGKKTA
jgi:hypothetical protein